MATPDIDATPGGGPGPVPEDNLPGHHPAHDQDKPERRPPRPRARRRRTPEADAPEAPEAVATPGRHFPFAVAPRYALAARLFGIDADRAVVEVDQHRLTVRFGRWTLSTALANVAAATVTGPYDWWKVAGPPHLSFSDGGITFATTAAGGVCIVFHEPVPALLPVPALRHGSATVTVAEPEALVAALAAGAARAREVPVA
jgi:hypothetical protein